MVSFSVLKSQNIQICERFSETTMSFSNSLDKLFPAISPAPSANSPMRWPGTSAESADATRVILQENHIKFHTYYDPRGFHNHISHYVLALHGLGAHTEIIQAAYAHEAPYQALAIVPPGEITAENFTEHLGDDRYYESYRKYFANTVEERGISAALEHAVSIESNFNIGIESPSKQPEMLNRLLDGLLHPMIHAGYGAEFGLPGLVVEGLACAAVHKGENTPLIPTDLWNTSTTSDGVHAFSILARIVHDPRFDETGCEGGPAFGELGFDISKDGEVARKVEELVWVNTLTYGVGGWQRDHPFEAHFFKMHFVTSSLFLSSLVSYLKPRSSEILLRAYFAVCLTWWIALGRKPLDIEAFFLDDTTAYSTPESGFPSVRPNALPSTASAKASIPNPWFPIINTCLTLPDDHLVKLYRALAHYGSVYGYRKAGFFVGTELEGAERLDGTLFLRVAGLTEERILASPLINAHRPFVWDGLVIPEGIQV